MGHCIKAIIAPLSTAATISRDWPELPRLERDNGFVVFPVSAVLIDAYIAPDVTPTETGDEFMLLTNGFRSMLRTLSRNGLLAYVETEYFGGIGGQGALVCRDGIEIMPPTWNQSGTINDALRLIGMKCGYFVDEFEIIGFGLARSNSGLLRLVDGHM